MYKINFYKDRHGRQPVKDYLEKLAKQNNKDARIKLNKIRDYVKSLSLYGFQLGEPYIKHLQGEIWELRPIRDRILFVALHNDEFVLLHHFVKKTQKTPQREIEQAVCELKDLIERNDSNE